MKRQIFAMGSTLFFLPLALFFAGCGGGGSGGSGSSGLGAASTGGTGTLSLNLADATTNEYQAVYVTIEEVQVHRVEDTDEDGPWHVVASPNKTYNLLDLVNGVREPLGVAELGTGRYTQMRLIIADAPDNELNLFSKPHPFANYAILYDDDNDPDNDDRELKVPSGFNTGIKIVHGFHINENDTTELILDFDAARSIVQTGSDKYLLKPTIKVLDTETHAIIHGTVTDKDTSEALEGVLISAQIYDGNADDDKDTVTTQTSTISNESGNYRLFVQPGSYRVTAYLDEYAPTCATLVADSDSVYEEDFELEPAPTGWISGNVSLGNGLVDQHVTISIRQDAPCGAAGEEIEIRSIHMADGGAYKVVVPEGSYTVVASTFNRLTQVEKVEVTEDDETEVDFDF